MATTVATGSGSPITMTLAAGNYTFTVAASNGAGTGPSSGAVSATVAAGAAVILVNRGTWSSTAPYAYDDFVTYNGTTWYCVSQTGVLGVTPGTDSTRWGTAHA